MSELTNDVSTTDAMQRKPLRIVHIEISRFRRLQAVRLDVEQDTTVLVGANNSGKTAVVSALRLFLRDRNRFCAYDIGAENWENLRRLGDTWTALSDKPTEELDADAVVEWQTQLHSLNDSMPTLDVWFDAHPGDFHHISHLIPRLDWSGGLLGVRLRLEPAEDIAALQKLAWSYRQARLIAVEASEKASSAAPRAWPTDLLDYWLRHPEHLGRVAAYKLDPAKLASVDDQFRAQPQRLGDEPARIADELNKLVRLDVIHAQRGLGQKESDERGDRGEQAPGMFSRQLVQLAERRFDRTPFEHEAQQALQTAIASAQAGLDDAISDALEDVTKQVQKLGYPGLHDPQELVFRSRIRTKDLLDHNTSVQYLLEEGKGAPIHLPEHGIGLGYQNLQALTYKLYAFRDERLTPASLASPAPVHLVLVEEPEAHLHVQAQRVFVNRAYDLLKLPASAHLSTQLVISTHSSHIAHAVSFAKLRYVRRAAPTERRVTPSSTIIGLNDVFTDDNETRRFVERYLRIQHSDLLFADAAIFVEGAAERLLVPQFLARDWTELESRFLSYLEVGGSHAHRLRPLVERLGIPTLIITDLDPADEPGDESENAKKAPVDSSSSQTSTNPTLKKWHPQTCIIADLLAVSGKHKELQNPRWPEVSVRIAYQVPSDPTRPCGSSFEDALVLENEGFFRSYKGLSGPIKKMHGAVVGAASPSDLASKLHKILRKKFDKAEFALDLLNEVREDSEIVCPRYIRDGLEWLNASLARREQTDAEPSTRSAA